LDSRYLRNGWSDLPESLESGPYFCKNHAKIDDANQSEHSFHMFFTFHTFFRTLLFYISTGNSKFEFYKKVCLRQNIEVPKILEQAHHISLSYSAPKNFAKHIHIWDKRLSLLKINQSNTFLFFDDLLYVCEFTCHISSKSNNISVNAAPRKNTILRIF